MAAVPVTSQWDAFLPALLRAAAARLCEASGALERVLHHEALPRLAGIIADLAERFGVPGRHGVEVGVPLAQHDLASMAGTSRETANRSLCALRAMGWVDRDRAHLVVADLHALRRFAQEGP